MEMKDAIIARRSVRSYTGQPLDGLLIDSLAGFISDIRPLHDNIPVDVMLYEKEDFHKEFGRSSMYRATDFVVIRSAMSVQGYLQNAGFIGEQITLWLTHKGIASCWAGMAKQKSQPSRGELPYIISIEFGRGNNAPFRRLAEEVPRKKLHEFLLGEISRPEFLPVLEAGRLAPSAVNMQPVRFLTVDDAICICRKKPPVKYGYLEKIQQIDVGVAMANMYVMCDGNCTFVRQSTPPELPQGYIYEYTMFLGPRVS